MSSSGTTRPGREEGTPAPREGLVLLVLFLILFLASADNQLLIPLLPLVGRDLVLSNQQLGQLFSVYAFSAAFFNLLVGPLSDRYGRVPFLKGGLLGFALVALLTWRGDSYRELLACRGAAGLLGGTLSTCTASFVGDFFPYEKRGRRMGAVLSSYFAALILGIPLAAGLAEWLGWRPVFLASSLASLGILVLAWRALPARPGPGREASWAPLATYGLLLRQREAYWALWVSFLVSGATQSFLTYLSPFLHASFGLSPMEISLLFFTAGLATVAASPLSGWLSDRWTKRQVFLLANSFLVVPLLLLQYVRWGAGLLGLFFAVSLCIAFRQTALQTLQTQLASTQQRGSYLALRNSFSQLGIGAGVLAAGWLEGTFGYPGVLWWSAAWTATGSGLLLFFIPEPDVKQ